MGFYDLNIFQTKPEPENGYIGLKVRPLYQHVMEPGPQPKPIALEVALVKNDGGGVMLLQTKISGYQAGALYAYLKKRLDLGEIVIPPEDLAEMEESP